MFEIAENIYCFPVPLPGSPLKELNCYIIKDAPRSLIVDVGFNTNVGLEAVTGAFKALDLSIADTDIFLTHLHADHTGLIEVLKNDCGRIFISEADSIIVNRNFDDEYWIGRMKLQEQMGFPEEDVLDYKDHPAYTGGTSTYTEFEFVTEGMGFSYGGYNFEAIDLKGHTPGQMGLYDKERGVMFCGDHILNKITPNIGLWNFEADYLGLFLSNLKKVRDLNVKNLLSAHRAHIDDPAKRIDELLSHHEKRLNRILSLLTEGKSTAYDIAMDVPWDFGGGYFGNFPPAQKWFAASEVFAHLEHLRALGKAGLKIEGPTYKYIIKGTRGIQ